MIKQNWCISSEEKIRILQLHEYATKNLYLMNEQTPPPNMVKVGEKKTTNDLPPIQLQQNYPSGYHSISYLPNNGQELAQKMQEIANIAQQNPNLLMNIQIEVGESQVPNRNAEKKDKNGIPVKLKGGELAKLRGIALKNYLTQYFKGLVDQNIISKMPKIPEPTTNVELNTQKHVYEANPEWTDEERKTYNSDPKWKDDQYIKFNISLKTETIEDQYDCLVNLTIDLSYNSEKDPTQKFPCRGTHNCAHAKFWVTINGFQIGVVDLSNADCGGCSKEGKIVLTQEQVRIIKSQPKYLSTQQMELVMGCNNPECHSDVQEVKLVDRDGNVLFHGCLGDGKGKGPKETVLMTMGPCGNPVIDGFSLVGVELAKKAADEKAAKDAAEAQAKEEERKKQEAEKRRIENEELIKQVNSGTLVAGKSELPNILFGKHKILKSEIGDDYVKFDIEISFDRNIDVFSKSTDDGYNTYGQKKGYVRITKGNQVSLFVPMNLKKRISVNDANDMRKLPNIQGREMYLNSGYYLDKKYPPYTIVLQEI